MDYTLDSNQTLLKEQLIEKTLRVTFTKVNGDERTMLCTLNPGIVPVSTPSKHRRTIPTTSCAVWDTEGQQWRSFRYDSIKSVITA